MASSTSSAFPLATEQPCTSDCGDSAGTANSAGTVDSGAGAGGASNNTFDVSTGGMIAIIIVVAFVVIMAGELHLASRSATARKMNALTLHSRNRDALLYCKEEGVESPRNHPQIRSQGRHRPDSPKKRVSKFIEG